MHALLAPARIHAMTRFRAALVVLLLAAASVSAQPRPRGGSDKMPITRLAPSKIDPNLCVYRYRISTASEECQAHFDQGLGYFYSYVWMEAARSFESALEHDPNCPMAYWGLYRALDYWKKS